MKDLEKLLSGGDLRSTGNSNMVASVISSQDEFDELFKFLFHKDRLVVMRAADALEKLSVKYPGYLAGHKKQLLQLLTGTGAIELQWHLAQLIARVRLTEKETAIVWAKLSEWAMDRNQSRIVRVNSLQSLFDLSNLYPGFQNKFTAIMNKLKEEQIPSLSARIRKLRKLQSEF